MPTQAWSPIPSFSPPRQRKHSTLSTSTIPSENRRLTGFRSPRMFFDALIRNAVRHANNYGFLRDEASGKLVKSSLLFHAAIVTIFCYNCSMKALEALNLIKDYCASQKGLFTTAQAQSAGVGRMTLSRLAQHGQIERIAHGVYKAATAPSPREENVYAAWLALDPTVPAWERPTDGTGFTASLNTAAWLHDLGELKADPLTFSSPTRQQTRNKRLHLLKRQLQPKDVTLVAGIPTTTLVRTVLDLIDYDEDLSLVASVLVDAERKDSTLAIKDDINARAVRRGFKKNFSVYDYLKKEGNV